MVTDQPDSCILLLNSTGGKRMLKFHVDLHSVDPEDGSHDVKFSTIVNAENEEGAKQEAEAALKKEKPELSPPDSWQWSVYEFPLG